MSNQEGGKKQPPKPTRPSPGNVVESALRDAAAAALGAPQTPPSPSSGHSNSISAASTASTAAALRLSDVDPVPQTNSAFSQGGASALSSPPSSSSLSSSGKVKNSSGRTSSTKSPPSSSTTSPKASLRGAPKTPASPSSSSSSSSTSTARPRHRRLTTHVLLSTTTGETFILSSLSTRSDTQVFSIDPLTGELQYTGTAGKDLFPSEAAATSFIFAQDPRRAVRSRTTAYALLGYIRVGAVGYIVAATKIRPDARLFGGHTVYTIVESNWVKITLGFAAAGSALSGSARRSTSAAAAAAASAFDKRSGLKGTEMSGTAGGGGVGGLDDNGGSASAEARALESLTDFPIDGLHFYCESLDITRAFPSMAAVDDYDADFVWNEALAAPFTALGMRKWCCVLLQGLAVSRTSGPTTIALFTRKSCLNPGTRYYARGVNDTGEPGNEMECEILTWIDKEQGSVVPWTGYAWRRGTVPLWWRSELKSSTGKPEIVISNNPYEGTEAYWQRLMARYGASPITVINLLRAAPGDPETGLGEHYQTSLKRARRLLDIDASIHSFDWHRNLKTLGRDPAIEGLWSLVGPALSAHGVSAGTVKLTGIAPDAAHLISGKSLAATPHGMYATHERRSSQDGLLRFNCADSLDRTNLSTFFLAMQVLAQQYRLLGLPLQNNALVEAGLDPASVLDLDPRYWPFLGMSFSGMESLLGPALMEILAEFFTLNGDVVSMLYTNTPALFTGSMREFAPNLEKASSNVFITLVRRYQNVIHDHVRQSQYEMFLGLNRERHFPSSLVPPSYWMSSFPAAVVNALPGDRTAPVEVPLDRPSFLLTDVGLCWITPEGTDSVSVMIYLRRPCHVTELGLTIRRGAPSASYPAVLDVHTGPYADQLTVVHQSVALPRTPDGTRLYYRLAGPGSGLSSTNSELYPFEGKDPTAAFLSRVVNVSLHGLPHGGTMTLGHISVLGVPSKYVAGASEILNPGAAAAGTRWAQTTAMLEHLIPGHSISGGDGATRRPSATFTAEGMSTRLGGAGHVTVIEDYLGPSEASSAAEAVEAAAKAAADAKAKPTGPAPPGGGGLTALADSDGAAGAGRSDVEKRLAAVTPPLGVKAAAAPAPVKDAEAKQAAVDSYTAYVTKKLSKKRKKSTSGAPISGKDLSFLDVLEVESTRVRLEVLPSERDAALVALGEDPAVFNPNRFVFPRDEKMIESVLKSARYFKAKACGHNGCPTTFGVLSLIRYQCYYCYRRFCQPHMNKTPVNILEYMWGRAVPVCVGCASILSKQESLVDDLIALVDAQSAVLVEDESSEASAQLLAAVAAASGSSLADKTFAPPDAGTGGEASTALVEYPHGGLLYSVPTAEDSPPPESVLFPLSILPLTDFWRAPQGERAVDLVLMLAAYAQVDKIVMLTDALGYSAKDVPSIEVFLGNEDGDLESVGQWNIGPVKGSEAVEFVMPGDASRRVGRVLKLALTLPAGANDDESLHVGRLMVHGIVLPAPKAQAPSAEAISVYQNGLESALPVGRVALKLLSTVNTGTVSSRALDLVVEPSPISGFALSVRHGDEGYASQLARVRVTVLVASSTGEAVSQSLVGTFVVPMAKPSTVLYYDFEKSIFGNRVTFEMLGNYGGRETVPGKISLF